MPKKKKRILRSIAGFLVDPVSRFFFLSEWGFYDRLSDEKYIRIYWKHTCGGPLNLDHPKTYNEKVQWLKLHDRRPLYTILADKYLVRTFVSEKLGEKYLVPLLGVWNNVEDIDFDLLPKAFVLKCNHNSGTVIACKDKTKADEVEIKRELCQAMKKNYYLHSREWAYKDIPHKIIAEEYLENSPSREIVDYKLFCFDGKAEIVMVCHGEAHSENRTSDFYDRNFQLLPFRGNNPPSAEPMLEKPACFDEMISCAEILSTDIPHVRVDFLLIGDKLFIGEMTLYPWGGFMLFDPPVWNRKLGDLVRLDRKEEL